MTNFRSHVNIIPLARNPGGGKPLTENLLALTSAVGRGRIEVDNANFDRPGYRLNHALALTHINRRKRIQVIRQSRRSTTKPNAGNKRTCPTELNRLNVSHTKNSHSGSTRRFSIDKLCRRKWV